MSIHVRHLVSAALVAGGVALAGCGGDDEPQIPRGDASEIVSLLQEVERRMSQERPVCGDVSRDFPRLEAAVAGLPEDVDGDIRESLDDGVAHLRDLIEAECAELREPEDDTTDTTDSEPETTPDTTPETTPTTPDTTPTTPETTPTTPETTPTTPGSGGVQPGDEGDGE